LQEAAEITSAITNDDLRGSRDKEGVEENTSGTWTTSPSSKRPLPKSRINKKPIQARAKKCTNQKSTNKKPNKSVPEKKIVKKAKGGKEPQRALVSLLDLELLQYLFKILISR
jgi:hypothetical protein